MKNKIKNNVNILNEIYKYIISVDKRKRPKESVLKTEFKIYKLIMEINNKENCKK